VALVTRFDSGPSISDLQYALIFKKKCGKNFNSMLEYLHCCYSKVHYSIADGKKVVPFLILGNRAGVTS